MVFLLMPIIFFAAIICVALEDKIKINKSATMILSSVVLWSLLLLGSDSILGGGLSEAFNNFVANVPRITELPLHEQYFKFLTEYAFLENLGEVTTTLFFVIGSMVIVEIVDAHGGFNYITNRIRVNTKRKLLWVICFLTFVLSMVLNDIATAILMVAILRTFISNSSERMIFSCLVIIAANAGGSCSPIGDVTTILLWTGGNLTPAHQISHLIIPALVCAVVPILLSLKYLKKNDPLPPKVISEKNANVSLIRRRFRAIILILGVLSLACVPIFNEVTGLPPFMGVMGGLAVLWVYTDLMYNRITSIKEEDRSSVLNLLPHVDMATILFFFGVLMSVAALNVAGNLQSISTFLNNTVSSPNLIAFILGIVSSFLDNVALVAATMGMYPLTPEGVTDPSLMIYAANSEFWTFISYCCVTGGSILIIGSATGVSVMGIEKISFGYYLKKFTVLAFIGYCAGAATYLLLFI